MKHLPLLLLLFFSSLPLNANDDIAHINKKIYATRIAHYCLLLALHSLRTNAFYQEKDLQKLSAEKENISTEETELLTMVTQDIEKLTKKINTYYRIAAMVAAVQEAASPFNNTTEKALSAIADGLRATITPPKNRLMKNINLKITLSLIEFTGNLLQFDRYSHIQTRMIIIGLQRTFNLLNTLLIYGFDIKNIPLSLSYALQCAQIATIFFGDPRGEAKLTHFDWDGNPQGFTPAFTKDFLAIIEKDVSMYSINGQKFYYQTLFHKKIRPLFEVGHREDVSLIRAQKITAIFNQSLIKIKKDYFTQKSKLEELKENIKNAVQRFHSDKDDRKRNSEVATTILMTQAYSKLGITPQTILYNTEAKINNMLNISSPEQIAPSPPPEEKEKICPLCRSDIPKDSISSVCCGYEFCSLKCLTEMYNFRRQCANCKKHDAKYIAWKDFLA